MSCGRIVASAAVALGLSAWATFSVRAAEPSAEDIEFFEKQVRPILVTHCQSCHGAKKQKANLRLDSRSAVLKGGDTGPAIEPGKIDDSLLIDAINYGDTFKMPPKGKLPDDAIAALTEWVKRGAPWPASDASEPSAKKPEPFDLRARATKHWSFQPIRVTEPPPTANTAWPRSTVDRFLLAKLEAAGLKPAAPADKRALIRRVTFDLIGLPPTPAEIENFLADESPQAFERVVDRLLASPHFGERWARHWLDLVRFAETRGHEFDFEIPQAFEYRDYVIRAFNADLPYNQFVTEHVAGDLLPVRSLALQSRADTEQPLQPTRPALESQATFVARLHPSEKFNESVIGTGFWFLGEGKHSPVDIAGDAADRVDNQIDVFGKTFLGLTLGCARCHDHKFDAISTRDYYALAGYLQSSRYHVACIDSPETNRDALKQLAEIARERRRLLTEAAVELVLPQLDKLDQILLAAGAAIRNGTDVASLPADVQPWAKHLREVAVKNRSDPFHPWAAWSLWSGEQTPEEFARFLAALREPTESAASVDRPFVFADSSTRGNNFWFGTGVFPPLVPPQALTFGTDLSPALQGTLRSQTFEIGKRFIHFRLAGTASKLNLIIDGFQLIRNPIYGGLTITPNTANDGRQWQWVRMDVSKWIGHRAYVELIDDGLGRIAVDRIVFSDEGSPTDPVHPVVTEMLERLTPDSPAVMARAYRTLFTETRARESKASDAGAATRVEPQSPTVLEWMLSGTGPATVQAALASRPESRHAKRLAELDAQRQQAETRIAFRRHAMSLVDGNGVDEHVFIRGNPKTPGDVVPRRFIEAFGGEPSPKETGSGRLELARRTTDPQATPIVPRVIVNRVWQHLFGEGIARTPDDFGNMGQPPSHPELLDFLADEFVRDGWSIKRLIRRLLLMSAYQLSSHPADAAAEAADPQNKLWHRMPIRRLEAESVRDAMLAVSGRLDRTQFGQSVPPHLTPFMIGRGRPAQSGPLDGDGRRSIYINVRRNFLTPMFLAFDYPVPFSTIGRRSVSNVPAQSLTMLNNPFVQQQAEVWAQRVVASTPDPDQRVTGMYVTAFGRPPDANELQSAREFFATQSGGELPAWTSLAHVLFNVKEFVFVQ